jgi:hypothetical protein
LLTISQQFVSWNVAGQQQDFQTDQRCRQALQLLLVAPAWARTPQADVAAGVLFESREQVCIIDLFSMCGRDTWTFIRATRQTLHTRQRSRLDF